MENANILQAIEQYRRELEQVAISNPATRYFPTHTDLAVEKMREFHQVGQQLWANQK